MLLNQCTCPSDPSCKEIEDATRRRLQAHILILIDGCIYFLWLALLKRMQLVAHLLAKSSVNAICLIDLGVEKALVVGLHRDAMLGANRGAGTAATAVMFVGNINHCFYFLFSSKDISKRLYESGQ